MNESTEINSQANSTENSLRTKAKIDQEYSEQALKLGDINFRFLLLKGQEQEIVQKMAALFKEANELPKENSAEPAAEWQN
jgi:hypothetical protein